jgi:hypothetical protein
MLMANMVACMTGAKHGAMRNYPHLTVGQQHFPCRKVGKKMIYLLFWKRIFTAQDILCISLALSCAAVGILSIAFKKHYSNFQKRYICNGNLS